MKMTASLILFGAFAGPAAAQVVPYSGTTSLDQQRIETQRLRAETDRREAEARLHQLQTQTRLSELETARRTPLVGDPVVAAPVLRETERTARAAATAPRHGDRSRIDVQPSRHR